MTKSALSGRCGLGTMSLVGSSRRVPEAIETETVVVQGVIAWPFSILCEAFVQGLSSELILDWARQMDFARVVR